MKTVAYLGLSGPVGYDYTHSSGHGDGVAPGTPNAVLENVSGLLICYDEIVFIAPEFCPQDMRELPYVSFLVDTPFRKAAEELVDRSSVATVVQQIPPGERLVRPNFDLFSEVSSQMRNGRKFAIDNHNRPVPLSATCLASGNSMVVENALVDLACSQLIPEARVDVIVPTPLRPALTALLPPELDSDYFSPEKRRAASEILGIRTPNILGPKGAYHEIIEEAREHKRASEFRDYLRESNGSENDGVALARQIERTAIATASRQMEKTFDGPHKFWTWGVPAARGLANYFAPGSGTGLAGLLTSVKSHKDRRELMQAAWAPFVLDMKSITM